MTSSPAPDVQPIDPPQRGTLSTQKYFVDFSTQCTECGTWNDDDRTTCEQCGEEVDLQWCSACSNHSNALRAVCTHCSIVLHDFVDDRGRQWTAGDDFA